MKDQLEEYIRQLPKGELHLHLEGSVHPELVKTLAVKYETELKDASVDEIKAEVFRYRDFAGFLNSFKRVCEHLQNPEDYLAALDHLEGYFVDQNIRYAEIIYTPSIPWFFGRNGEEILRALLKASKTISEKTQIEIRWILDCVRQFGPELAEKTAGLAVQYRDEGVVAIGLGGDENSLPMAEFEKIFAWARANQLYIHVHAGEIGDPQQVWDALQVLGANRIGHGIQAARDPRLMEYLRDHVISLDVCLTSNVCTRAWPMISEHPLSLLYRRGVPITLNTDDPGLFSTTLCDEYRKAAEAFHLESSDLQYFAIQGVRSSFLPHFEKMELMKEFHERIRALDSTEKS